MVLFFLSGGRGGVRAFGGVCRSRGSVSACVRVSFGLDIALVLLSIEETKKVLEWF